MGSHVFDTTFVKIVCLFVIWMTCLPMVRCNDYCDVPEWVDENATFTNDKVSSEQVKQDNASQERAQEEPPSASPVDIVHALNFIDNHDSKCNITNMSIFSKYLCDLISLRWSCCHRTTIRSDHNDCGNNEIISAEERLDIWQKQTIDKLINSYLNEGCKKMKEKKISAIKLHDLSDLDEIHMIQEEIDKIIQEMGMSVVNNTQFWDNFFFLECLKNVSQDIELYLENYKNIGTSEVKEKGMEKNIGNPNGDEQSRSQIQRKSRQTEAETEAATSMTENNDRGMEIEKIAQLGIFVAVVIVIGIGILIKCKKSKELILPVVINKITKNKSRKDRIREKIISLSRKTTKVASECNDDEFEEIAQYLSKQIMLDVSDKIFDKKVNQVIEIGVKNLILNNKAGKYEIDCPIVKSKSNQESLVEISIDHIYLDNDDLQIVAEVFTDQNIY